MPLDAGHDVALCSTCHRPLVQPGPAGECVRCLFTAALLPDEGLPEDDFSEAPAGGTDRAHYGHFQILTEADGSFQELGAGAMGATYRAQDGVLHRTVALKVISRGYAGDPATRTRFLREARAAARLRHVNVASVYHYGEQDGQCFYAMELVEGETLEMRVRREGPLPTSLALEVAVQTARALAAAEAQGIVHRDLKPSNIMLVPTAGEDTDGAPVLVKVIDFGLAKAAAATGPGADGLQDTRGGGFVGTPAFASPEQHARREDERIDTRSDIYSLGVTLWYLLTATLPFAGRTLGEIHEQQVAQPLPLAQLRKAAVPAPLAALLQSMLAVAPTARPPSARALLDALRRVQKRVVANSRHRVARWSAVAGLCACLVAGIILWRAHARTSVQPSDRSVAVLPLENFGSDPAEVRFVTGLQEEITNGLGRIANLTVSSSSSVKAFKPGKRDLAAIGRELGVAHLLEGNARQEGGWIKIKLRLVDLRDPARPWVKEFNRQAADLFAVQSEIARAVADQLQASLSPEEKIAIDRPPTHDLVAYDFYLRSNEGPETLPDVEAVFRDTLRKIELLDQAVARDPNFTRAYCSLARQHDYLWSHGYEPPPGELAVDHRSLAEKALQKARRLEPDSGDVHLALASHLQDIGDSEQAGLEADLACASLPNSAKAQNLAGTVAMHAGQTEKSRRCFERAVVLNPLRTIYRWMVAITYGYQRRGEECDRVYAEILARVPADDKSEFVFQRALAALEDRADLAPLRAVAASFDTDNDPDGESRLKAGLILHLYEHDASAASHLLAASGDAKFVDSAYEYPKAWFEALVARMRHDPAAAQAAFTAARPVFAEWVAKRPANGRALSYLAMVDAGLGRGEDAVREGLRACELCPYQGNALDAPAARCNLAVAYLWTGQSDPALALLAEAAEKPAGDGYVSQLTYGDLQLNPIWDPLRQDPRFAALVQRLAPRKAR